MFLLDILSKKKLTIKEMRVHMDCAGCENKVKHAFKRLKGIDDIDIDKNMQKVTVTGWVDPKKLLKTVRQTGLRAEFWQLPYNSEHDSHAKHNYNCHQVNGSYNIQCSATPLLLTITTCMDMTAILNAYNGHPQHSSIFGHPTGAMFSDENPHGCSIMRMYIM